MRGRQASVVAVGFVMALVGLVGAASPAVAGTDRGEGDERAAIESSSASGGASQLQKAACSSDEHRCGAGDNFVCCDAGDQCCRHKGGVLYCAKKKCSAHQP